MMAKINAQEIYCTVQVSTPQIEGTDKRVFEALQKAMYEFINNRKWTAYSFKLEERIECSILLTINKKISVDEFKGKLNLILRRPVYNTAYDTPLFNYVDNDFQFKYVENQPLDYSDNTYTSELTSVIAYYMYIFLGLDFDTFSLLGGQTFFEKAQEVVNSAQNSPYPGWKSYEDIKNRYWLVENYLNPSYKALRNFNYSYHRSGLDMMSENAASGRSTIGKYLGLLKEVNRERPGLFVLQLLVEAKRTEFINIFEKGTSTEKTNAVNILKEIDPANSSEYQKILNN